MIQQEDTPKLKKKKSGKKARPATASKAPVVKALEPLKPSESRVAGPCPKTPQTGKQKCSRDTFSKTLAQSVSTLPKRTLTQKVAKPAILAKAALDTPQIVEAKKPKLPKKKVSEDLSLCKTQVARKADRSPRNKKKKQRLCKSPSPKNYGYDPLPPSPDIHEIKQRAEQRN